MKNILIIGCGLLGSSLLRRIKKKKLAKKIFIFEKSKKNLSKIKKLKLPGIIIKKPEDAIIIDTTLCSFEEQVNQILKHIEN